MPDPIKLEYDGNSSGEEPVAIVIESSDIIGFRSRGTGSLLYLSSGATVPVTNPFLEIAEKLSIDP